MRGRKNYETHSKKCDASVTKENDGSQSRPSERTKTRGDSHVLFSKTILDKQAALATTLSGKLEIIRFGDRRTKGTKTLTPR